MKPSPEEQLRSLRRQLEKFATDLEADAQRTDDKSAASRSAYCAKAIRDAIHSSTLSLDEIRALPEE